MYCLLVVTFSPLRELTPAFVCLSHLLDRQVAIDEEIQGPSVREWNMECRVDEHSSKLCFHIVGNAFGQYLNLRSLSGRRHGSSQGRSILICPGVHRFGFGYIYGMHQYPSTDPVIDQPTCCQ